MALTKKDKISIRRRQLDESLPKLAKKLPKLPRSGWLKEIRELLLMSKAELAKRATIAPSTLVRLEQSEVKKSITLKTLEHLAEELNCDVHYVLIPRRRMIDTLNDLAEKFLRREEARTEKTMRLEGQGGSKRNDLRRSIEKAYLIVEGNRDLWRDE